MSNRIYPVTKEQLDSGEYAIVQSYWAPKEPKSDPKLKNGWSKIV